MRPLLSLAIPTFNRVAHLSEMAASVESELARSPDLTARLELVVSDNASDDATDEFCRSLASRTTVPIRYRRNDRNVGGPANLVRAMEHATGEYCMYIGDDDRIATGGLARAIAFLEGRRWSTCAIFANVAGVSEELTGMPAGYEARMSLLDAAASYFFVTGTPAGCAIRTEAVRAALPIIGPERLARTNWPQTVLAFVAAHRSGSELPIAACHDALAHVSQHHLENTLYTAWICWQTWFQGPLSAARIVEEIVGPGFVDRAAEDIFTPRRIRFPVGQMLDHLLAIDSQQELARFRARIMAALPDVPVRHRGLAERMLERAGTPRLLRIPTLVYDKLLARPGEILRDPRVVRARLGAIWTSRRYRASHFERLARYRAGQAPNIRNYAEEGY